MGGKAARTAAQASAMSGSPPLTAQLLHFRSAAGDHLFVAAGSRIFDIDSATAAAVDRALLRNDPAALPPNLKRLFDPNPGPPRPLPAPPPITAISLNLMQACNMGCSYCYAEQGSFGGPKRAMPRETARASVDRLLEWTPPNARAVIAFMGGEPFLARELLHDTVHYAWRAAAASGRSIAFSLTTNASLIENDDAALLAGYPFSVTVSIDGPPSVQDRQRPMIGGGPSSQRVHAGLARLLARRPRELTARMSVGPDSGPLLPILDYVLSLGFDSAGFAPIIAAPSADAELDGDTLAGYTEELIRCGRHTLAEYLAGRRYRFSNFDAAMGELHRGSARAHPCGAGAGYVSVAAGGEIFACHRLVGDAGFRYGDVAQGLDDPARMRHLRGQAVDQQMPCGSCWARYLCGGGCYHEVSRRGRIACDHLRGWLAFCLEAYVELSQALPDLFDWQRRADPAAFHPVR